MKSESNVNDTRKSALKSQEDLVEERLQRVQKGSEDEPARQEHENKQHEDAHAVINLNQAVRQEVPQNVASIKRRKGNQIEDEEQKINQDDKVKQERDGK